jgi:hypothetical protein
MQEPDGGWPLLDRPTLERGRRNRRWPGCARPTAGQLDSYLRRYQHHQPTGLPRLTL